MRPFLVLPYLGLVMQFTLLCSAGRAQVFSGPLPSIPNQGPKRTITGTVVNAISGEPIRHALVQVNGPVMSSALTGADGRFQIDNVPEGQVVIRQKPGFFDASSIPGSEWRPPNSMMTVGSGKNDFKVTLIPAAKLVGRVTDQDGEGVENMSLQVLCEQIFQGRKQWQPRNGGGTDDDGTYRFDGLLPSCVIYAGGDTVPPAIWNAPPLVTAPAYYPDSRDVASAQAIDLHPGQELA